MITTRFAYMFFVAVTLTALPGRAAPPVATVLEKLTRAHGKSLQVRWNRSRSRPRLILGLQLQLSGRTLRDKVERFAHLHPGILVPRGCRLAFVDQRKSKTRSVLRYEQRYQGVPVFRRQVLAAFDRKRRLVSIHSSSAAVQIDDIEAKASANKAASVVFAALHGGREIPHAAAVRTRARLVILAEVRSHLTYAVRLPIGGDLRGRVHLVDAKTGIYLGWRPGVLWERPAELFAAEVRR